MPEDPIVAETHRTREALAAEFGFDVKAIFADLRKRQVTLGERLVRKIGVERIPVLSTAEAEVVGSTPAR